MMKLNTEEICGPNKKDNAIAQKTLKRAEPMKWFPTKQGVDPLFVQVETHKEFNLHVG
jgi:hypothetical protein